ncbi:DeoR/GlpR family DNA-binding transcription regulator [Brevibacillus massiliensis]|jgi:DeoR/GlpR family transcriptional regulator of sugar metabolism|uniref:DeoR/GlpR family DNA-binding transcription regulator n=1 Tax=Brevibacillus massiliensis TaxID=1118054 RepID=UPI0002D318A2|nr:DeoR/GlpR family DNA-binding transcription regulator [Brevibacillus massiliensis]
MTLLPEERKQHILEQLQRHGKIQVAELARCLTVTPETIRRDLDDLEKQKLLQRVHGGAISYVHAKLEPHFKKKQGIKREAKISVGRKAASLVQDGDTIALDVGTTTLELARALKGVIRLTVVTNSLPAATVLNELLEAKVFDGRVIVLGGVTNPRQKSITGALTCELLSRFRFDKAFISCGGITPDGISDYDMEEALCSAQMVQRSERVYVLADGTKLAETQLYRICRPEDVTAIICDQQMPDHWRSTGRFTDWITAGRQKGEET